MPIVYEHDHENEITLFGEVNFRNSGRRFGIKTDDRRRHMYIIGKTGMGKSTLMENMILSDIYAGHGCCYIDPHGDVAEKLLDFIPPHRINDVVYFNPADTAYPVGFNILESPSEDRKHLVRDGLMGVFKKIWPDVWSARMEYILQNCVSALLDYPGATLMGINRLLVDKEYREKVVDKIRDPVVKTFWVAEFTSWSEKYATEAIAPVQNKVGQFLSSSVIRNIVAQVRSTIDIRRIMDDGKILIANLSKGRVGEDGMRLLGGMLVTKIQLSAQERQSIKEERDRRDFYLYVDEFQNFANESFATILSEARKYRLNLTVAHQYMAQLEEEVQEAVLGNVGTMIVMRVGPQDAELMETEFAPTFTPEDLVSLAKFQMYIKLMVDGVSTQPFSANSMPPIAKKTGSTDAIVRASRERYAEPRHVIEQKVLKWSGMELIHAPHASIPSDGQGASGVDFSAVQSVPDAPGPIPGIAYPKVMTEDEQAARASSLDADAVGISHPKLVLRPERQSAIDEAQKAAKAAQKMGKRPSFPHTCQRCGKAFSLAIQLDPSKPVYCQECRDLQQKERENRGGGGPRGGRSDGPSSRSSGGTGSSRPPSRGDRPARVEGPRREDRSSPRSDRPAPRSDVPARPDAPREGRAEASAPAPVWTPRPVPETPPSSTPPSPSAGPSISGTLAPGETFRLP